VATFYVEAARTVHYRVPIVAKDVEEAQLIMDGMIADDMQGYEVNAEFHFVHLGHAPESNG
jgi:hypothetical protein